MNQRGLWDKTDAFRPRRNPPPENLDPPSKPPSPPPPSKRAAVAARDAAMERVEKPPLAAMYAQEARVALVELCADPGVHELTAEDVREKAGPVPDGANPKVLGPVMMWGRREGLIEKTGRYLTSDNPTCHAAPKAIWRVVR